MSLLRVDNLSVEFPSLYGEIRVVDNVSLQMRPGEVHGLVGESGSGKSLVALGLLGLLDASVTRSRMDHLSLNDKDLLRCSASEKQQWLTRHASIIFQDAQSSLNPAFTIGYQLDEIIKLHHPSTKTERMDRAKELLHQVGVHNIAPTLSSYPHELTGSHNQRIMIALALACEPALLIADEPTTGQDVTVQAQILDLLFQLNETYNMGLLLITHDIALLNQRFDRVTVMYCGQVVESGEAKDVLHKPHHPYTQALLDSTRRVDEISRKHLWSLRGATPSMLHLPVGCYFGPRCPHAERECVHTVPLNDDTAHLYRCWFPLNKEQDV